LITSASGYASTQTWDITPTLADGHHLLNSEVVYASGGTITATTPNALLAVVSGNNVLNAGSGDSILIGGTGHDVLNGGAGDDFLIAGNGVQTLYGGSGSNYLRAGSGSDTFLFHAADAAHDTVVGFKAGVDQIDIVAGGATVTAASLLGTETTDSGGDVVLHLSASHDVTLIGIHAGQPSAAWLVVS
jgi:Ca2+-binding RTX toxin-like protein